VPLPPPKAAGNCNSSQASKRQGSACDVVIYFTDAKGVFPKVEPNYPVMWLIKGKEHTPWGTRIQLN
jgi:predicted metal-dependent peptidase